MTQETAGHWDGVYGAKPVGEVSWYQRVPGTSLRLLAAVAGPNAAVVDVGAGTSTLVDELCARGWHDVTVLDVSAEALALVEARLAATGAAVQVVTADVRRWRPDRRYDVWHDRAVFHFLTDAADRERYVTTASGALRPGGHLVIATFAADGPTSCSGLPTARYDADRLGQQFATDFEPVHAEREEHRTPWGSVQPFTWVVLRRR